MNKPKANSIIMKKKLPRLRFVLCFFLCCLVLSGCGKEKKTGEGPAGIEVTAVTIKPQSVPITFDFVGQAESSHQIEIRARVDGFLEKRLYEEGSIVREGQVMFQMDRRPFEASLQEAKGELAQQQARWEVANANLARVKPLAAKNAVSKKDLDDAVGNERSAAAAVISAQGKVRQAELNLSYTTIKSPVGGMSSRTRKHDGSYVSSGPDSFLTYVAKLDPIWINFSVSENERLGILDSMKKGTIIVPKDENYDIEIVLSDGTLYPKKGRLNFADPSFSQDTGTFLVRGVIANPSPYVIRPGQFVRVKLMGAVRPNAVVIPRRAVMQGAKGHFVWVVEKNNTAEFRSVTIGDWIDDGCFISEGLKAGDRVVVDGGIKLAPAVPVTIAPPSPPANQEAKDTGTAK
ncbi:MAG: efflux RND transporter periplasmic adaptor subunit [Syntrophales bacterium]|nr:efflux RND transporter periplasmic adaptor subunit [Syntrophales bacterium]